MSNLPANEPRCDGLLPRVVRMPDGRPAFAWLIDCPTRDTCARYLQFERDDPAAHHTYTPHFHERGETCPDFLTQDSCHE